VEVVEIVMVVLLQMDLVGQEEVDQIVVQLDLEINPQLPLLKEEMVDLQLQVQQVEEEAVQVMQVLLVEAYQLEQVEQVHPLQ
tara:strand:+ start:111 stop:359 length:249 start_codon:yes stop_codon:yes gene_type:complete